MQDTESTPWGFSWQWLAITAKYSRPGTINTWSWASLLPLFWQRIWQL